MSGGEIASTAAMGVSKTAGLAAVGAAGGAVYRAYSDLGGSASGLAKLRSAQRLREGGIGEQGAAGEAILEEVVPSGSRFQVMVKGANGRKLTFNGKGRKLDALYEDPAEGIAAAWESKNGYLKSLSGDTLAQAQWDSTGLQSGRLTSYDWMLWRGGSPAAIRDLTNLGLSVKDFGPVIPAWDVLCPGYSVLPGMQNAK